MAKIDLPKRSGKRSKVREKSVKSQGILKTILSGNPVLVYQRNWHISHFQTDAALQPGNHQVSNSYQ